MNDKKNRFGFKNQTYDEQLAKIPYNFAVKHDEGKKVTTITIYGAISSWGFGKSTSVADVDAALKDANGNDLVIRLNSPGGDAFEGVAIYNRLVDYKKEHNAKIKNYVDGWACSAASFLPLAADEAIMGLGAMCMIHETSTIVWGTKQNLRKTADMMEKLEDGITDIYMTKAKKTREEIKEMMDEETWFTAQEAVDLGFATAIMKEESPGTGDNGLEELKNLVAKLQSDLIDLRNSKPEPKEQEPKEPQKPKASEPKKPAESSGAFLF